MMNRFRTIFSKTNIFSRLNSSHLNRFSQIVRPFSICGRTDLGCQKSNSFPFTNKLNHNFNHCIVQCNCVRRSFSSDAGTVTPNLSEVDFEHYCAETLESLTDYFDELVEKFKEFEAADVMYKDGVLTVNLGNNNGIYVINKQTPNKQIWLSSPCSGPKRFDYVPSSSAAKQGYWIYKHTGIVLHELLDKEFSDIVSAHTAFQQLPFGTRQ